MFYIDLEAHHNEIKNRNEQINLHAWKHSEKKKKHWSCYVPVIQKQNVDCACH